MRYTVGEKKVFVCVELEGRIQGRHDMYVPWNTTLKNIHVDVLECILPSREVENAFVFKGTNGRHWVTLVPSDTTDKSAENFVFFESSSVSELEDARKKDMPFEMFEADVYLSELSKCIHNMGVENRSGRKQDLEKFYVMLKNKIEEKSGLKVVQKPASIMAKDIVKESTLLGGITHTFEEIKFDHTLGNGMDDPSAGFLAQ